MKLPNVLLLLAVILPAASGSTAPAIVELHHRFIPVPQVSASNPEWLPLGSITVDAEMSATKLTSHPSSTEARASDDGKGWYQVAVERDGEWVIGSTRACLLAASGTAPSLTLHLVDTHITSLSLHPSVSRCSNTSVDSTVRLPSADALWEITLQRPARISSPSSAAPPPPADPTTGLPAVPPPEKSFLQKYWLPMLGIGLFLAGQLGGSGPPAEGAAGGQK